MIAAPKTSSSSNLIECVHKKFLEMLPRIRQQAVYALHGLRAEAREEMIEEIIANAFCAFVRLVQRGKVASAFPTPLAKFAVSQVRAGRRVGGRLNINDLLSSYAQRQAGFKVERLDRCADPLGLWSQALIDDHHTPVDKQAAFRLDFPAWLSRLAPRQRQIAEFLATGNSTSHAARRFRLSAGRISQLRRDFHRDWLRFHGELPVVRTSTVAA